MALPTEDMRSNLGTWAVPTRLLPAVAAIMLDALDVEDYDKQFVGQQLITAYYDTKKLRLRKARKKAGNGDPYITLRTRAYENGTMAISAKTEAAKFRVQCSAFDLTLLPTTMQQRVQDIAGDRPLLPVAFVYCRRFGVENAADRLTLDADIYTDADKRLKYHVLEFKSTGTPDPPARLVKLGLKPIKMSKFLWATK